MSQHDFVLWIDLETTGTNEFDDLILEVGAILTPRSCNPELFTFVNVVEPIRADWKDILAPEVRKIHEKNGLADAIDSGIGEPLADIESNLLNKIRSVTGNSDHVIFAGSGVSHFDRRFIRQQMPHLDRALTYWPWDMGTVRRFFHEALPANCFKHFEIDKPHRALPDARAALREWRTYTEYVRLIERKHHSEA